MRVALLAGGTGGAKLGAGLQDEVGGDLTVIANTGDDIEALGVHVSPDPDLITYWLSGEIDEERGWGIREDTFTVFERIQRFGAPGWFGLSDRDLAACLYRRQFLADGGRPTDAQAQIGRGVGIEARVLPMSDQPVRTKVITEGGRRDLQEYLILDGGKPAVLGVELEGIAEATPTAEVLDAIRIAEAIVIGPSNPVISIGPILAVPGMREAIAASPAPVLAVSPYVAGAVVKGPTNRFMEGLGRPCSAAGVASLYAGLIDAMVIDQDDPDPPPAELPTLAAPTLMEGVAGRSRVARTVLDYAESLAGAGSPVKATAVLPVKRFDAAKTRLAGGIEAERHGELIAAMVADVLEAIGGARTIERTIMVTGEPLAQELAAEFGATVVPDPADAGHNEAALAGIARAEVDGADCVVLLPGDCPLLDPRELDKLLTGVPDTYVGVVPDRHGEGTNALVLAPPSAIVPSFGEGSRARHVEAARAAGVAYGVEELASLGLDLDTPADVVALTMKVERDRSRARRTAKVLGI